MSNAEQITPERLMEMMQAVIDAGRQTELIKAGYLEIFSAVMAQVPKRHARIQFNAARQARSAVHAARRAAR